MKEKVFNVKQNFFRILVLVIVVMSGSLPSRAIVVDNGNKSTEYLLDYASGEKEALEFSSRGELDKYIYDNLNMDVVSEEDSEGCVVDCKIQNALFSNYISAGLYSYTSPEGFYWHVKSRNSASSFELNNDGYYSPEWDSYMLPSLYGEYALNDGATQKDVKAEILELETKEIGECQLIKWMANQFDAPPVSLPSTRDDSGYLPADIIYPVINIHLEKRGLIDVIAYLGMYNPADWNLRAVTRLKFRVTNVHKKQTGSVETCPAEDNAPAAVYDLCGRMVLTDASESDLCTLPKGIYIFKGRKIII